MVIFAAAQPAQVTDKKEIIRQARHAYYSLKDEGLIEFQCNIVPNWRAVLTEQKMDPDTVNRAVPRLSKIHFSVSLAPGGDAKVTHTEIPAENEQMAQGLSQIYSGMEQMVTGFFETWSVFVVSPPLPEIGGDYRLEKTEAEYRLSYKEGTADIVTLLDRDLVLTYIKTSGQKFDSTIRPQFKRSAKGLLMTGYRATYLGESAADATELQVAIDYQEVNGLQLPQKLELKGTYGNSPFHVEVAFTGCHATRR